MVLPPAASHPAPLWVIPRVNCKQHFCCLKLSDYHQRTRFAFKERGAAGWQWQGGVQGTGLFLVFVSYFKHHHSQGAALLKSS